MNDRHSLRRLALALRRLGLFLVIVAVCGLALRSQPAAALGVWIADIVPPALKPAPGPSASPPAPPRFASMRGGPLTFSLSGALTVGERSQSSTRGDALDGSQNTLSQSQGNENAGLLLQLFRRTAQTSMTLALPAGASASQRSTFGQLQAAYYTPHFGLQYQPQALSALGVIPTGSTAQSLTLVLPLKAGDISIVEGSGPLDNENLARVLGVRARTLIGRGLYELGIFKGARLDGQSSFTALLAGFALDNGTLEQMFEAEAERTKTQDEDAANALAYSYRADYGEGSIYSTVTLRHITDGFLSIGNGSLHADDAASVGFHFGNFAMNESLERLGGQSLQPTITRDGSLTYSTALGRAQRLTSAVTLSDQRVDGPLGFQWIGSAGLQLGASFNTIDALFDAQLSRSTSSAGRPLAMASYEGELERQFGTYALQVQTLRSRQLSATSLSTVDQSQIALTRQWGLTSLQLSDSFTHTQAPAVDSLQTAPLLTIARRISPTAQLSLTYGEQRVHDAINPSASGRSRVFSIQVTAPFAIGNGLVQGHPDPRLPATIVGGVINDVGSQGAFASTVSNGVGNVLVVLDGVQTQRTDLSGHFQFNFVTPGHHTVRLDLSSLPRGVTPDQPIASLDLAGGQQGSLFFRIGTYAAVQGKVLRHTGEGTLEPIAGAVLMIDGNGGIATTGLDGSYGFGRLTAGTHTIVLQNSSLPATVSFGADNAKRTVNLRNGEIVSADFIATPLGSIAGQAVYDPKLAPDLTGGAFNSYVVAEPGEYAAIVSDDGSFIIDNVPPGTYTVDLDPETVPEGTGNVSGAQRVTLAGDQHIEGLQFIVGRKIKPVIFSLKQSADTGTDMILVQTVLPPGGATEAIVNAPQNARSVVVTAFDRKTPLKYDKGRKHWSGLVVVPLSAPGGTVSVVAESGDEKNVATADLKVDPSMPLATFQLTPRNPSRGQYVSVRARFFAPVEPGDEIRWADGQVTKLTTRITGRIYTFTVKISVQPLNGLLLTRQGQLPILLR